MVTNNSSLNYQLLIDNIVNNSQVIINNSCSQQSYYMKNFRLINSLFLPSANSLIISLIYANNSVVYSSALAEGSIIKLVENNVNIFNTCFVGYIASVEISQNCYSGLSITLVCFSLFSNFLIFT